MLFSLIEKGGLYAGDHCRSWIEDKLDAVQPGLGAASFAEFHRRTGSDLSITVSDTSGQELLVLNPRTAPDCPVVWAVRASMSIPFVFQEVVWRAEWGRYRGRDITGHVLIDGGVLSNFPIKLLASSLAEVREIMGDTDPYAVPNLGLLIDEALPVDGGAPERGGGVLARTVRSKPVLRVERIIETLLNAHDRAVIEACMANHEICRLPAKGYSAIDFDMSDARVRALIAAGRRATSDHLDQRKT
jgi:predicted acylesterase/phospholipase RssA